MLGAILGFSLPQDVFPPAMQGTKFSTGQRRRLSSPEFRALPWNQPALAGATELQKQVLNLSGSPACRIRRWTLHGAVEKPR